VAPHFCYKKSTSNRAIFCGFESAFYFEKCYQYKIIYHL
jgi:hypothetical protein